MTSPPATVPVRLPVELVAAARQAVARGHAGDLSAYVAAALEEKLELDHLGDLIDALLLFAGPLPGRTGAARDGEPG